MRIINGRLRAFELAEVNAALPDLAAFLHELRLQADEVRTLRRELRRWRGAGPDGAGRFVGHAAYRIRRARLQTAARRLDDAMDDMFRIGCYVRSLDLGIVDFPGVLGGRSVLYCWRLGEPEITHYHDWNEGFGARRPLRGPIHGYDAGF